MLFFELWQSFLHKLELISLNLKHSFLRLRCLSYHILQFIIALEHFPEADRLISTHGGQNRRVRAQQAVHDGLAAVGVVPLAHFREPVFDLLAAGCLPRAALEAGIAGVVVDLPELDAEVGEAVRGCQFLAAEIVAELRLLGVL